MKALVFKDRLEIRDVPVPEPAPHEALIRILMAGICNTDIEITKGYMNFQGIPGHEFVGRVEVSDQKQWIGKRVVGEINIHCNQCVYCRKGMYRHCPNRSVLGISGKDGVFAEYITLPARNLHAVPENIQNDEAVFVEPLAAACRILEQIDIKQYKEAAVIGDGKLGLLIAMVLQQAGSQVFLYGRHAKKMDMVRGEGVQTRNADAETEEKYNLVIEASGSSAGFDSALRLIKPTGTLILKSTTHDEIRLPSGKLVVDEVHVIGSRCGPFPEALKFLKNKKVNVRPLISGTWPFHQVLEAFHEAERPASLKILLRLGE